MRVDSTQPSFALSPYSDDGFRLSAFDGNLYRFPTAGGAMTPVGADPNVGPLGVTFTPDGKRALFTAGSVVGWRRYSYPLAGGGPQRIYAYINLGLRDLLKAER